MTPIPPHIARVLDDLPRPVCAYVYDLASFSDRVADVTGALPTGARLYYAMKANARPELLARAARDCHGIEIASAGELAKATAAGARHLVYGGPSKTDSALTAALTANTPLVFNIEGEHELRRLHRLAREHGLVADIALRVNRKAETPPGSHRMTGVPTPFGIDAAAVPRLVRLAGELSGVKLGGLHLHAVSNNLDADAHASFVADAFDYAARTAREFGLRWSTVNVGGGIGVDPAGGDDFDLEAFAARMRQLPDQPFTPVFELGRYLAAETGWYACEVTDLKTTHGRDFAVVRGGTHHFRLPAAWGYNHPAAVHPLADWPYPWPRPAIHNATVDVTGELCTPRDVLCRDLPVRRLRIGDVLVFARTGAYGWDISHHEFLSHDHPDVVAVGLGVFTYASVPIYFEYICRMFHIVSFASAASSGAAFASASATSASGALRHVMPPPAHTCAREACVATVRMVRPKHSPAAVTKPIAPIAGPRPTGSRPAMCSRAASFGVPVTDPGGHSARSSRARPVPADSRARISDSACHRPPH